MPAEYFNAVDPRASASRSLSLGGRSLRNSRLSWCSLASFAYARANTAMIKTIVNRVMTGAQKRAAEVQAAAANQQEPLHTQSFANRAHAAGECKTRTAQKAHVEAAKAHALRVIEMNGDQSEMTKRDVLGNLLTVVQDSQHPGDWAIRACLNYMNSQNCMTKGVRWRPLLMLRRL